MSTATMQRTKANGTTKKAFSCNVMDLTAYVEKYHAGNLPNDVAWWTCSEAGEVIQYRDDNGNLCEFADIPQGLEVYRVGGEIPDGGSVPENPDYWIIGDPATIARIRAIDAERRELLAS